MLVLVTYDVKTSSPNGVSRLRRVSKECVNYCQRVQNSVFECNVDPGQFEILKRKLEKIADKNEDSIRYYFLGSNWKRKIEHFGSKEPYDSEGTLII